MKYREWLVGGICLVSSYHLESQMLIEPESLVVVSVHIHLVDLFLADGILYQSLSVSLSLFVGVYKQHLGFEIIGRDETDSMGKPYPILHLQLTDDKK